MSGHFLIRRIPFVDENLKSYLIRLAEANKTSVFQVYKIVGLIRGGRSFCNLTMITDHSISLDILSELSTISMEELIRLTYYEVFGRYIHKKSGEVQTIFRFGLKTKYNQICSLCLKENPYIRKRWDIGFYTCCHIHKSLMINKCPSCSNNLSITSSMILCKFGYDLRTSPVTFVPENETDFSRLISEKLDRNDEFGICNNLLIKMDLLSIITSVALN